MTIPAGLVGTLFKPSAIAAAVAAGPADPYFSYVKFLAHYDSDTSDVVGHALASAPSASVSSAQSKFGGSSLNLTAAATAGKRHAAYSSTDFAIRTQDFTFEGWVYPTAGGVGAPLSINGYYPNYNTIQDTSYSGQFNNANSDALLIPTAKNAGLGALAGKKTTIEFWYYCTGIAPVTAWVMGVFGNGLSTPTNGRYAISLTGSGTTSAQTVGFWYTTSPSAALSVNSTTALNQNTWNHVAITIDATTAASSTVKIYTNGVGQTFTGVNLSSHTTDPGLQFAIGRGTEGNQTFNGRLSDFRVVRDIEYKNNFTPSGIKLTAIPNTTLLTLHSSTFVDESTSAITFTTQGSPTVATQDPLGAVDTYGGSVNLFNWGGSFIASVGSSTLIEPPLTLPLNQWSHIAISRAGTNLHLSVNGVVNTTVRATVDYLYRSVLEIGDALQGGPSYNSNKFTGYVDDVRLTVGIARYTSNFTVPTAAFANSAPAPTDTYFSNVSLLLHGDGTNGSTAIVDSSATSKTLSAVGNTQISTAQKKFGTGSMYFDGSGDYLIVPASSDLNFGTGDFTIEGWFNWTSLGNGGLFHVYPGVPGGSTAGTAVGFDGAQFQIYTNGPYYGQGGSVTIGTWYHVAYVRSSGSVSLYINGVQQGPSRADATNYVTNGVNVGLYFSSSYTFPGYIDDFRVTKGVARYTSNFSVPTEAFPNA